MCTNSGGALQRETHVKRNYDHLVKQEAFIANQYTDLQNICSLLFNRECLRVSYDVIYYSDNCAETSMIE